MRKEESDPRNKSAKNTNKLSLKSLGEWNVFGTWRDFDSIENVSWSECTSSCIECEVLETWMLGMVVVGGIYSPQPPKNRWGGLLSMGTPDTVRCASHVTQPLGFRSCRLLEALSSSGTGQSGATPDRHYSVSDAPLTGDSDSARTILHCSSDSPAFAVNRFAKELLLRWCTGQSGGTPDSPVNYSEARPEKPESGEFKTVRSWCTGHCPVRQTRAHSVSLLLCI
jgi:hypothetical protein